MDGVAQRLLQASKFRGNLGGGFPEDALRQPDMFRIRPVKVDPQNSTVLANMRVAGSTLKANTTGQMRFGGDIVSHFDRGHPGPEIDDMAAHLVPDDSRRMDSSLRPFIPTINVIIGAAQRGGGDPDNDLCGPGLRHGNILKL